MDLLGLTITATDIKDLLLFLLGGAGITPIIIKYLSKQKDEAHARQIATAADKMRIESELDMAAFWKKSSEDLSKRLDEISAKLDAETLKRQDCNSRLNDMDQEIQALKVQISEYEKEIVALKAEIADNKTIINYLSKEQK